MIFPAQFNGVIVKKRIVNLLDWIMKGRIGFGKIFFEKEVQQGRGISLMKVAQCTNGPSVSISKAEFLVMTGGTGLGIVEGKSSVIKKISPEADFFFCQRTGWVLVNTVGNCEGYQVL